MVVYSGDDLIMVGGVLYVYCSGPRFSIVVVVRLVSAHFGDHFCDL